MKIIRESYPPRRCAEETITLSTFADRHGLNLKIEEQWQARTFSARLDPFIEVMHDGLLGGASGHGRTETDAISDLCRAISRRRLVVDAMSKERRREFDSPTVVPDGQMPTDDHARRCGKCGRLLTMYDTVVRGSSGYWYCGAYYATLKGFVALCPDEAEPENWSA